MREREQDRRVKEGESEDRRKRRVNERKGERGVIHSVSSVNH